MSISSIQLDPSAIGIAKTRFAIPPNPARIFSDRAARFDVLAKGSRLSPYLEFLACVTRLQSEFALDAPSVDPLDADRLATARSGSMPPIDRNALIGSPGIRTTVWGFLARAERLAVPPQSASALAEVRAADDETIDWIIGNILSDTLPLESLAHHIFVAAGAQIYMTRLASTLEEGTLVPVGIGLCPACGGRPVGSMVVGFQGAEGARYAVCACCFMQWNEVRVKCLACGSTKGVGYRAVETGEDDATVKAEVCDNCRSWTKILYQNKNPSLDMVADDVASLGLDTLMKETEYRRAGFDPFLVGY
ncbi:formate dehydrogenase accessory protein FdhE [Rhizobium grahamii]|uniref:Protein FdhE homolog n=1 Tax=Rhizobium grahamii TaxID=1120045 RepID=A0A370KGL9_9HYPH|nr:formate dehydrogenase accessory protein FdhE [Rhizobium grahamii]RDJ03923.1 formate dehydrogenase accessory protein FdhE [Rhizobium grahamii]